MLQAIKIFVLLQVERWQSGRMRRSWKPLRVTPPGVRIPPFPQKTTKMQDSLSWILFFMDFWQCKWFCDCRKSIKITSIACDACALVVFESRKAREHELERVIPLHSFSSSLLERGIAAIKKGDYIQVVHNDSRNSLFACAKNWDWKKLSEIYQKYCVRRFISGQFLDISFSPNVLHCKTRVCLDNTYIVSFFLGCMLVLGRAWELVPPVPPAYIYRRGGRWGQGYVL